MLSNMSKCYSISYDQRLVLKLCLWLQEVATFFLFKKMMLFKQLNIKEHMHKTVKVTKNNEWMNEQTNK